MQGYSWDSWIVRKMNLELEGLKAKGKLNKDTIIHCQHQGKTYAIVAGEFALAMLRKQRIVSHPESNDRLTYKLESVSQKTILLH